MGDGVGTAVGTGDGVGVGDGDGVGGTVGVGDGVGGTVGVGTGVGVGGGGVGFQLAARSASRRCSKRSFPVSGPTADQVSPKCRMSPRLGSDDPGRKGVWSWVRWAWKAALATSRADRPP